jgi:hypothetical protein
VKNIDLCDSQKRALLEKFMAMPEAELKALIEAEEKKIEEAEENFKEEVQKLQNTYQKLNEDKEKIIDQVKKDGLGMMKSVLKAPKDGAKDEL